MHYRTFKIISTSAFLLCATSSVESAELFVSPNGKDSNSYHFHSYTGSIVMSTLHAAIEKPGLRGDLSPLRASATCLTWCGAFVALATPAFDKSQQTAKRRELAALHIREFAELDPV